MERAKMKWIKQARFKTNQLELIGFLKTLGKKTLTRKSMFQRDMLRAAIDFTRIN